jgi:hypothetical protein
MSQAFVRDYVGKFNGKSKICLDHATLDLPAGRG